MEIQNGPNCHRHVEVPTSLICLTCQDHLLCTECLKKEHKLHMIIKISTLNQKIPQFRANLKTNKNADLLLKELKRIKESLMLGFTQLENVVNDYDFKQIIWIGKQQQQINGQISDFLKRHSLFKLFLEGKINEKQAKSETQINLMENLNSLRSVQTKILQIFESTKNNMSEFKRSRFVFSNQLKHPSLKIDNDLKIFKGQILNDGHSHLALLNQNFSPMKNKVSFRIKGISGWGGISFGICQLQKVRANNYFKCWKMGSGTYGIYVNEYKQLKSNHSSLKNYSNSLIKMEPLTLTAWKSAGFGEALLAVGDVISLVVNYFQEKIKFIRNQNQKAVIQIPIDLGQGPYYGFVGLSWIGDVVQIV